MSLKRIVSLMRHGGCAILLCLLVGLRPGIAAADLNHSFRFEIPAQRLPSALLRYSEQSGVEVTSPGALLEGKRSPGVEGRLGARSALERLLEGTALTYDVIDNRTVVIRSEHPAYQGSGDGGAGKHRPKEGKMTSSATFRVAQMDRTAGGSDLAVGAADANARAGQVASLQEVIVTAQKREQRLIDVPVPVTAISGPALIEDNQVRLQDYFETIPGLNFTTNANGGAMLSIRGLTSGGGNPTTSVTIDGVPFGSSSTYGAGPSLFPDIDPSDLERVEVLRGPQGTLYGASSLGGLVNYVTVEPSVNRLSGRVEADLSAVQNAEDPACAARAAANVPISDAVALRVSGFGRETPGYIDNIASGEKGTNRLDAEGGYLSLLARPSDRWSLRLSALYQHDEGYGLDYADPELGDLKQNNIPGTGRYHSEVQAYSAIFKARWGAVQLTSLSGYSINSMGDVEDVTNIFGPFAMLVFGVGGVQLPDQQTTDKASQEIRLSMPLGGRVDWMLGLFYTHEKARMHQDLWAENVVTGAILPGGNILDATWPTTYTEEAAFTDITVRFTSRLDVQFGGRESENRQTYSEVDGGGYTTLFGLPGAPAPLVTPEVDTKDNAFTYLITPRFRWSRDMMVYARVATGYRPGGPNPTCSAFDVPCHFGPDRTQDYEIGVKGDLLDHRVELDSSIFYIDWRHIQLDATAACGCGADIFVNAGSAKSQGLELSLQAKPIPTLTLGAWVDFTDAVLTAGFPPSSTTVANSGDRLPFSSRLSGNIAAEKDWPLSSRATLFVGGQASYVGNRLGYFEYPPPGYPGPQRAYYPAYPEIALRAGVVMDDWRVTLFANNVANERGTLGGQLPVPYGGDGYSYIQPRTIGISVAKSL